MNNIRKCVSITFALKAKEARFQYFKLDHGTLQPENVLLESVAGSTTEHIIKITDFGLAKMVGENVFMTTMCGTPNYLGGSHLLAPCDECCCRMV